jgi:NADH dehydrogenase
VLKEEFRHINPAMTRIVLVEAGPRILATFPPGLARRAHRKLSKLHVEIYTGDAVTDVDEQGVMIGEKHIQAASVFWTAGVMATPVARWLDAEADRVGRVKVQKDLSVPNHPNVFVIGDVALCLYRGKPLPGVAPVAMQQGRYVAGLIKSRISNSQTQRSFPAFRYKDKGHLATVGRGFSIIQMGPLRMSGFIAWFLWLTVHIFYLITFENRLLVMLQWAWAYLAVQRRVRLITVTNAPAVPVSPKKPSEAARTVPTGESAALEKLPTSSQV